MTCSITIDWCSRVKRQTSSISCSARATTTKQQRKTARVKKLLSRSRRVMKRRRPNDENCLGHHQVAGDYGKSAGRERRDAGSESVVDLQSRSTCDEAGDQIGGGDD